MRVEFADGDYDISLTSDEIEYLLTPGPYGVMRSVPVFPSLESTVLDAPTEESLNIAASQDAAEIFSSRAHDRILFERDDIGPMVTVFTGLLDQLLTGTLDVVGTRYDGYSDKIIIRKEDRPASTH